MSDSDIQKNATGVGHNVSGAVSGTRLLRVEDTIDAVLSEIMQRRGFIKPDADPQKIAEWLSPSLVEMCADIGGIPNMDAAAATIYREAARNSRVLVFGDYDADGICSIASILRLLRLLDCPAKGIVPNRMTDGHGVSEGAASRIIDMAPDFLIVLDCGTTSVEQLTRIAGKVPNILVLDHHSVQEHVQIKMPNRVSLINPAIDRDVGIREKFGIASTGVLAYLTVLHTIRHWRKLKDQPIEMPADPAVREVLGDCLGLAAITAITDMVPLRGLNRAIVRSGLRKATSIFGIRAIAKSWPKPLRLDALSPVDVGFKYGPVLNAAGRIADGQLALRLMCADSLDEALPLATQAIVVNEDRRGLTKEVIENCLDVLDGMNFFEDTDCGIFVFDEEFHQGVVGLAASRLLENSGRPSIVVGRNGSGSGRSIPGFHIGDFIGSQVAKGRLSKGGGHAGAAGFTLDTSFLEEFRADFFQATTGIVRPEKTADLFAELDLPIDLGEICEKLQPFGMNNDTLRLEIRNPAIIGHTWFGSGKKSHLKVFVRMADTKLECLCFNAASRFHGLEEGAALTGGEIDLLVGTVQYEFNDYRKIMTTSLHIDSMSGPFQHHDAGEREDLKNDESTRIKRPVPAKKVKYSRKNWPILASTFNREEQTPSP